MTDSEDLRHWAEDLLDVSPNPKGYKPALTSAWHSVLPDIWALLCLTEPFLTLGRLDISQTLRRPAILT